MGSRNLERSEVMESVYLTPISERKQEGIGRRRDGDRAEGGTRDESGERETTILKVRMLNEEEKSKIF